jgi:predicted nucleic-acid-binding Zn-ribbon protein
MSQSTVCQECGSRRVFVQVNITTPLTELEITHRQDLQLEQPKRSIGFLGLGGKSNTSSLVALSCTNCGYTTFYAREPENLIPDKK